MKKIIILILILIICVGGFYILRYYYTNTNDNNNVAENNNLASNETNNTVNETVIDDNTSIDTGKSNFEIVKVKEDDFKNYYEIEEQYEIINKQYFNIDKENTNVVITLIKSSQNEQLLKDNNKLTYNKKYTISNVNAEDVNQIFYGGEGQDLMYPVVYLLLKDGTVKGVDIENGYNTGNFIAETISGLKDVQKIEQANASRPDDSGYACIVAILNDESVYEIREKTN